jgi:hypothetical protein
VEVTVVTAVSVTVTAAVTTGLTWVVVVEVTVVVTVPVTISCPGPMNAKETPVITTRTPTKIISIRLPNIFIISPLLRFLFYITLNFIYNSRTV